MFGVNHDDCKNLIKRAGDHMVLRVERGDFIVPNMDEAFPKKKEQAQISEPDGSEQQVKRLGDSASVEVNQAIILHYLVFSLVPGFLELVG